MTFEEVVQWLRLHFPTDVKVEKKVLKNMGWAICINNKFYIEIHCTMPLVFQIETLLHEWAHILTWPNGHSDNWVESMLKFIVLLRIYVINIWEEND